MTNAEKTGNAFSAGTSATRSPAAIIDDLHQSSRDWCDVENQIRKMPPEAASLARELSSTAIVANAAAYTDDNSAASSAQNRHRRHATRTAVFGFLAACLAGTMLYLGLSPKQETLGLLAAALQATLLTVAFSSAIILTTQKPYRSWAEHRGRAETRRIRHFQMLLAADPHSESNELPYKQLALEYVRAFLLEDQRSWFKKRGADFATEVKRRIRWQLLAICLVGISGAQMGAVALTTDPVRPFVPTQVTSLVDQLVHAVDLNVFVLLGLIGGALQTLVTCRAAISLADRNAATYARMADVLDELLAEPLSKARQAAADGDAVALERFWSTASFELIGEQREWGAALTTAQLLTLDKFASLPAID